MIRFDSTTTSAMTSVLNIIESYFHTGFKGTVMQIEKAMINDRFCVLKVSRKFCVPTIYNFVVIAP